MDKSFVAAEKDGTMTVSDLKEVGLAAFVASASAFGLYSLYSVYNYNMLSRLNFHHKDTFSTNPGGSPVPYSKELRVRIVNLDGNPRTPRPLFHLTSLELRIYDEEILIRNNMIFFNLGSVLKQKKLLEGYSPEVIDVESFGPPRRIECSFSQFWAFENKLISLTNSEHDDIAELKSDASKRDGVIGSEGERVYRPIVTFFGSNDFHHLALAFIRRIRQPFNLVRIYITICGFFFPIVLLT